MTEADDFDRWCERSEPTVETPPECGCGQPLLSYCERTTGVCDGCGGELADWYEDNTQIEEAEAA